MSDVFITADEHYGHNKIIVHCERPFAHADEMNEYIIDQHNRTVPNKQSYLTIHLGDWFWHTMKLGEALTILGPPWRRTGR